jgi:hypothetical protein
MSVNIAKILINALQDKLTESDKTELLTGFESLQTGVSQSVGATKQRLMMGTMIIGSVEGIVVYDPKTHNEVISLDPLGYLSIFDEDTLMVRLGNMEGEYGADGKYYGVGIGDYAGGNYLSYNAETVGEFILRAGNGGVLINKEGITIDTGDYSGGFSSRESYKFLNTTEGEYFWIDAFCYKDIGDKITSELRIQNADNRLDYSTIRVMSETDGFASSIAEVELAARDYTGAGVREGKITLTADATESDINYEATRHVFTGNLYTVPWTPYHDTSTIVGWSSYTTKSIYYKRVGNLVFVNFFIGGVSDDTTVTFTLPYDPATGCGVHLMCRVQDNGTWQTTPGWLRLSVGASTAQVWKNANSGAFLGSGNKGVAGQFWYEV